MNTQVVNNATVHVVIVIAILAALVICGVRHVISSSDVFTGIIGIAVGAGVYVGVQTGSAGASAAGEAASRSTLETLHKAATQVGQHSIHDSSLSDDLSR
jgi:hypothetical protein